jgi:N utilization substance protein B
MGKTGQGPRRQGRAAALQLLYQLDAQGELQAPEALVQAFFEHLAPDGLPDSARRFARTLCLGVCRELPAIDRALGRASRNWRLERMNRVDRSVLRLAAHELLAEGGPPAAVVINEAVELAREYGSSESARFVNGVLGKLAAP